MMSFDIRLDSARPQPDAQAIGMVLIRTCLDCGAVRVVPSQTCPECGASRARLAEAQGLGILERVIPLGEPDAFRDDPEITRAIGAVRLSAGPLVSVRIVGEVPDPGASVTVRVLAGNLIASGCSTRKN